MKLILIIQSMLFFCCQGIAGVKPNYSPDKPLSANVNIFPTHQTHPWLKKASNPFTNLNTTPHTLLSPTSIPAVPPRPRPPPPPRNEINPTALKTPNSMKPSNPKTAQTNTANLKTYNSKKSPLKKAQVNAAGLENSYAPSLNPKTTKIDNSSAQNLMDRKTPSPKIIQTRAAVQYDSIDPKLSKPPTSIYEPSLQNGINLTVFKHPDNSESSNSRTVPTNAVNFKNTHESENSAPKKPQINIVGLQNFYNHTSIPKTMKITNSSVQSIVDPKSLSLKTPTAGGQYDAINPESSPPKTDQKSTLGPKDSISRKYSPSRNSPQKLMQVKSTSLQNSINPKGLAPKTEQINSPQDSIDLNHSVPKMVQSSSSSVQNVKDPQYSSQKPTQTNISYFQNSINPKNTVKKTDQSSVINPQNSISPKNTAPKPMQNNTSNLQSLVGLKSSGLRDGQINDNSPQNSVTSTALKPVQTSTSSAQNFDGSINRSPKNGQNNVAATLNSITPISTTSSAAHLKGEPVKRAKKSSPGRPKPSRSGKRTVKRKVPTPQVKRQSATFESPSNVRIRKSDMSAPKNLPNSDSMKNSINGPSRSTLHTNQKMHETFDEKPQLEAKSPSKVKIKNSVATTLENPHTLMKNSAKDGSSRSALQNDRKQLEARNKQPDEDTLLSRLRVKKSIFANPGDLLYSNENTLDESSRKSRATVGDKPGMETKRQLGTMLRLKKTDPKVPEDLFYMLKKPVIEASPAKVALHSNHRSRELLSGRPEMPWKNPSLSFFQEMRRNSRHDGLNDNFWVKKI